jgi:ATP-dependent NAD(P)H-hydrate dehydratase
MPIPKALLEQLKQLIPPLNGTLHKGQSGWCPDYLGAERV